MTDAYTPTTEDLREAHSWSGHDNIVASNRLVKAQEFDRWLAKHDRDRDLAIAASVAKGAEQFLATANELRLEGEHEASARYYAYAAARTTIAYEIKTGQHS